MKTFSINEKLKLNKNTKISSKPLIDVEEGDTIYFHNTYWSDDTNNKLNKYSIYNIKVHRTIIDHEDVEDWICIMGKSSNPNNSKSNIRRFWFKVNDIKDKSIAIEEMDKYEIVSTNRSLLEKAVDDNIDKEIEPLQKKIDEIQDKINDLISKKEFKYNNIDY